MNVKRAILVWKIVGQVGLTQFGHILGLLEKESLVFKNGENKTLSALIFYQCWNRGFLHRSQIHGPFEKSVILGYHHSPW